MSVTCIIKIKMNHYTAQFNVEGKEPLFTIVSKNSPVQAILEHLFILEGQFIKHPKKYIITINDVPVAQENETRTIEDFVPETTLASCRTNMNSDAMKNNFHNTPLDSKRCIQFLFTMK